MPAWFHRLLSWTGLRDSWSPGTAPNPFAVPTDPAVADPADADPYHDGQWSPLLAPVLTNPEADQLRADAYVPPYTGPLDLDDYGRETDEMRRAYRDVHRTEPAIRSAIDGKAAAVAALDISVLPEDKDNPDDCAAARFVDWTVSRSPHGWDGLILTILRPALIDGFSIAEKVLKGIDDSARWHGFHGLRHVKGRDTAHLMLRLDGYRNVLGIVNTVRGLRTFSPAKAILFTHAELFDNPFGQSDLRAAYRSAGLIADAYKLWYLALKRCGEPYLHGKVDNPTNRKELEAALRSLRGAGWAVTTGKDEVALLDLAGAASFDAFERKVRILREDIFLAVRGAYTPFIQANAGAGESRGDTGISQQGGSDPVEEVLARAVGRCLTAQLVPDLVRPNFGPRVGLPRVVLGGVNWGEMRARLDILERAKKLGLSVSAKWAHETLQIPPATTPADELGGPKDGGGAPPGGGGAPPPRAFAAYVESEHPRDEKGRWIETGVAGGTLRPAITPGKLESQWIVSGPTGGEHPPAAKPDELERRLTAPPRGVPESQARAMGDKWKAWWAKSPERRKALADWYAKASPAERARVLADLDGKLSETERDAYLNRALNIPLPPVPPAPPEPVPPPPPPPPPPPRTGTPENLKTWQEETAAEQKDRNARADGLLKHQQDDREKRGERAAAWEREAGTQKENNRRRDWFDPRRDEFDPLDPASYEAWLRELAGRVRDTKNFELVGGAPQPITEEGKARERTWAEIQKFSRMPATEKLRLTLEKVISGGKLGAAVNDQLRAMLEPENLALMGGMMGLGTVAAMAGGFPAAVVALIAYAALGETVVDVSEDLYKGVALALSARSQVDIDQAATRLADGLGTMAVQAGMTAGGAGLGRATKRLRKSLTGNKIEATVTQRPDGKVEVHPKGGPPEPAAAPAKPGEAPKSAPKEVVGQPAEAAASGQQPQAAGGAGGSKPPGKPTATGGKEPPNDSGGTPRSGPTPRPDRDLGFPRNRTEMNAKHPDWGHTWQDHGQQRGEDWHRSRAASKVGNDKNGTPKWNDQHANPQQGYWINNYSFRDFL